VIVLAVAGGCASPPRTIDVGPVEPLVEEFEGRAPAQPRNDAERRAAYAKAVDSLLPGMAADEITQRAKPQQTLERMCHNAGRPGAEAERRALCEVLAARLALELPNPSRVWLLRKIEPLGGDECVTVLAKLLNDQDGDVRELARRALTSNPSPRAGRASSGDEWTVALINAVGGRREMASVEELSILCSAHSPPAVSCAALAALADIGDVRSVPIVASNLKSTVASCREAAADALLRLADASLAQGASKGADEVFTLLFEKADDPAARDAALRGIAVARGAGAVWLLLDECTRGEAARSALAAGLLRDIPGDDVSAQIAAALSGAPPALQARLLGVLGDRGDHSVRSAVLAMLQSEDSDVRVAALRALRTLGDSAVAIRLAEVAASSSGAEQQAARDSLQRVRGADVDRTLVAALGTAAPAVRGELVRALAARDPRGSMGEFFRLAAVDPDPSVQSAACEAIGANAAPSDAPKLVSLLVAARSDAARAAAENALVAACLREADAERRAAPVLAALPGDGSLSRAALVRALGRLPGAASLEAIRAAQRSVEPEVVDAAVRALTNWPRDEVAPDLLAIVRQSPDATQRVLALRGYVRLTRLGGQLPAETLERYRAIWELARDADEKKQILAGLAEVNDFGALELAGPCLQDAALRDEAAVTVLSIARLISGERYDEAAKAIDLVAVAVGYVTIASKVDEARSAIDANAGFITSWQVAGPFGQEGKDVSALLDIAFTPETGDGAGAEWRALRTARASTPWVLDFTPLDRAANRCVYVRTRVWSEVEQAARLELGSDDGLKVWLNGRVIHATNAARALKAGEDTVAVRLNAGWNTLLLKVTQGSGDWGACCRVRDPSGARLAGLKFSPE
jgi:hypothetical protein